MNTARRGKRDRWLIVLWLAVAVLGPIALLAFIAGIPLAYEHLATVCPAACEDNRLTAAAAAKWQEAGASMELYAAVLVGLSIALALVCFGVAGFLLVRRPRDRMAVFVALMFILLGTSYGIGDELVGQRVFWLGGLLSLLNQGGFGLFPVLFLTFPDGRFVPPWSRWLALALLLVALSTLPGGLEISDQAFILFFPIWALAGPISQVYRYRRISNPVQRQQIKWMAAGFGLGMGGFAATTILGSLLGVPYRAGPFLILAVLAGAYVFVAVVPISIALGILRYRLWDADVVIRKTLVYGLLTALLALVYFGSVVVLQGLFAGVTGEESPAIIVLSTLFIAALFAPLRRRVKEVIDRRFYRRKYNAARTLESFGHIAQDEVDMDVLSAELLKMVQETIQPAQVSMWLKQTKPSKLIGDSKSQ